MAVFSFEDLLEAKRWAIENQRGRRNLEKWELGKIALKLRPDIEEGQGQSGCGRRRQIWRGSAFDNIVRSAPSCQHEERTG